MVSLLHVHLFLKSNLLAAAQGEQKQRLGVLRDLGPPMSTQTKHLWCRPTELKSRLLLDGQRPSSLVASSSPLPLSQ
ncbi:hypothetical protein SLA2020_155180 [Shorea laevis]